VILKALVSWLRWNARRARRIDFSIGVVQTVVIVELTRLGDVITVLPVIREFRRMFPAARLRVVVDSSYAPILAMCGPSIEVVAVSDSLSPFGFIRALKAVRSMKANLICSMSPSNRNAALALASGSQFIIGYLNGTDSLTPFLGVMPVESIGFRVGPEVLFGGENIEGRSWKVLETLGRTDRTRFLQDFPSWRLQTGLHDDHPAAEVHPQGPYIVVHPFAGWEFRAWPIGRFVEVSRLVLARLSHSLVFICHESEREHLLPLQQALGSDPRVSFFPSADILTTAHLMRGADLFVGNDSGPLHLAALLGIPVVGLYGPAAPSFTAPLSARGTFLYHHVGCSPCSQTTCLYPENHCMLKITTEEVFAAMTGELSASRSRRSALHG
jgi:ADP-heptose:LPS heptosyltransferase